MELNLLAPWGYEVTKIVNCLREELALLQPQGKASVIYECQDSAGMADVFFWRLEVNYDIILVY